MENTTTAVFALILVIIVVSLLGFCIENIFIGFRRGFIDNRNMVLPFLLGYGLTIFGFYLLLGTPEKPLFFGKQITFSASWRATLYYFIMALFLRCSNTHIDFNYRSSVMGRRGCRPLRFLICIPPINRGL